MTMTDQAVQDFPQIEEDPRFWDFEDQAEALLDEINSPLELAWLDGTRIVIH